MAENCSGGWYSRAYEIIIVVSLCVRVCARVSVCECVYVCVWYNIEEIVCGGIMRPITEMGCKYGEDSQ